MLDLPFPRTELEEKIESDNGTYWPEQDAKLLDASYFNLGDCQGIPTIDELTSLRHHEYIDWDPYDEAVQSPNQSDESFAEQQVAMDLIMYTVKKYVGPIRGKGGSSLCKNVIIHGSPGSGKSFIGTKAVLYCKSQGLNVKTTALPAG